MNVVHQDLRPDNCGVIFEKITDTLILGTVDGKLAGISPLANGQIAAFVSEGFSVMMQQFNPHRWVCKMAKGVDKKEIKQALEDKADDSS